MWDNTPPYHITVANSPAVIAALTQPTILQQASPAVHVCDKMQTRENFAYALCYPHTRCASDQVPTDTHTHTHTPAELTVLNTHRSHHHAETGAGTSPSTAAIVVLARTSVVRERTTQLRCDTPPASLSTRDELAFTGVQLHNSRSITSPYQTVTCDLTSKDRLLALHRIPTRVVHAKSSLCLTRG